MSHVIYDSNCPILGVIRVKKRGLLTALGIELAWSGFVGLECSAMGFRVSKKFEYFGSLVLAGVSSFSKSQVLE